MNPEQAWQSALGQMQTDMSKATFDTWLRDVRLLSYQDGVFVIGVANSYARDWLDDRLTSTLQRILVGMMNRTVTVEFTVVDFRELDAQQEEDDDDDDDDDGDEEQESIAQPGEFDITAISTDLKDAFISPHQVVVIPGYFRRWISLLGATKAWIVVGFRQVLFLHENLRWNTTEQHTSIQTIKADEIARWSGVAKSTLWRHLDDALLEWFVQPQRGQYNENGEQIANRYQINTGMPITPMDAKYLHNLLLSLGIQDDPVQALEKVLSLPVNDILPETTILDMDTDHFRSLMPRAQSLMDIILTACGQISQETFVKVTDLAEQLKTRIMQPTDLIVIPWYFIDHYISTLGPAAAWLYILLRDESSREGWASVQYTHYAANVALAKRLGISRPETINRWFPRLTTHGRKSKKAPTRTQIKLARLLRRTRAEQGDWSFEVEQAIPLTLKDQADYDAAIEVLGWCKAHNDPTPLEMLIKADEMRNRDGGIPDEMRNRDGAFSIELRNRDGGMVFEMRNRDGAKCEIETALNHLLNHLKPKPLKILNHHRKILFSCDDDDSDQNSLLTAQAPPGVGETWNLQELLENSRVESQMVKKLLERNISPWAWVSWLLYWASPAGKNLREPVGLAVKRLLKNPDMGAGGSYDRLAQNKEQLMRYINQALRFSPPWNNEWKDVMQDIEMTRLRRLNVLLFGTVYSKEEE